MNIQSMNTVENTAKLLTPGVRNRLFTEPPGQAATRISAGPVVGSFRPDNSPVTSGKVIVGEADPLILGCRRVAALHLEDQIILLGQNPVSEEAFGILSPDELLAAANVQEIGKLGLDVPSDHPSSPFIAAAGLSRALCGFSASNEQIVSAFVPGATVPEVQDNIAQQKGDKGFDGITIKVDIKPRWTTMENKYGADIVINGSYQKGGRSPQLEIVAAVAALLTGTECPPAKKTQVDISVNVRVFCLERTPGNDGLTNGYDIPIMTEFHGETSVGGEFCDLANILVKAFT